MMPQMENKEPLDYPKSKQRTNLFAHCGFCKMNLSTDICFENGKKLKYCEHLDKHYFKVYVKVPGTNNKRKTKKLDTRDADEAIKMAIDFEREVKGSVTQGYKAQEINRELIKTNENSFPLYRVFAKYLAYLNNEGLPDSLKKERDKDYIKDIERAYTYLVESMSRKGYDMNTFSVFDIDYIFVGRVVDELKAKNYSNRTINKHLTYFTSAVKWYSEYSGKTVRNFFKHRRFDTNYIPKQFPREEFEALLKQITPENGLGYDNGIKPRRNYFYPWLVYAFRLALETGRRREELTTMKWSDIQLVKGKLCIQVLDIKVNRIKKRLTEAEKRYNPTPVTPELMQLLNEMGYEKYKGTDNFILAPEVNISRGKVMCNILSRSFAHYYKQLNTGKKLTFKSFRKTRFTEYQWKFGDNARFITGHTSTNILGTRYVDRNEIAAKAVDMMDAQNESQNQMELKKVREESKTQQKKKDLNR